MHIIRTTNKHDININTADPEPTAPTDDTGDISYLDQMLNSFIADAGTPAQPKAKPKGVLVLPEGPLPQLKPAAEKPRVIQSEVPYAAKDSITGYMFSRPKALVSAPFIPTGAPTRPPIPAAASTTSPAKHPALRATTTFTTLGRATINMDDLLDQVIHSIVTDDPNVQQKAGAKRPATQQAPPTEDEELLGQILSNQELNMAKLERKAQGTAARPWMVPFAEIEPFLQAKLGIGNHGESYRPGIWRYDLMVVLMLGY